MAIDLLGQTNAAFNISAVNFTADTVTGGTPPDECGNFTRLSNNTALNIMGAALPRGNNTAGIGQGNGVEQLYVCLNELPNAANLPSQTYSATGASAWTISVI